MFQILFTCNKFNQGSNISNTNDDFSRNLSGEIFVLNLDWMELVRLYRRFERNCQSLQPRGPTTPDIEQVVVAQGFHWSPYCVARLNWPIQLQCNHYSTLNPYRCLMLQFQRITHSLSLDYFGLTIFFLIIYTFDYVKRGKLFIDSRFSMESP